MGPREATGAGGEIDRREEPVTAALLALGAAAVAAATARWATVGLVPASPLTRRNYRGLPVPTGLGVALLAGLAAGSALIGVAHAFAPHTLTPLAAGAAALPLLALAFGFGLLGLFDDLSVPPERGWRAHLGALARGRVTGGTLKLAAGAALAFAVTAPGASSLGWAVADAALVALMANLFNVLDVRPGRAGKAFLVAGVPLAVLGGALQAPLAAALGATAAFLPSDLRERAMLGDAGSNALGAIIGGAVVLVDPVGWSKLLILAGVAALILVAEGPTLSAWIERIRPLRALDRAGRAPE